MIVSVGAEGGGVKLLGRRGMEGSWEFSRVTNDCWWILEEEELDSNPPVSVPKWVSTWDEAVTLLDRYPWAQLHPLVVHAEFRAEVLVEVTRRLLEAPVKRHHDLAKRCHELMAQWLAVCSGEPRA